MTAPDKIWVDYAECNKNGSAFDAPPEHEYQSCQDGYIRLHLHQSALADRDREIERLQSELDAANEAVTIRQAALEQRTAENERLQARLAACPTATEIRGWARHTDPVTCAMMNAKADRMEAANAE